MAESTPPPGPLSGVTVLDLTRVLAGPYCTMVLSDLGARVIKVEPPDGDDARAYGPWVDGRSAYFMSLNRGKESIALDLKDDADRRLCDALGVPELADDPRFRTNPDRMRHVEGLKVELESVLATDTTARWLERLEAAGVPCGPLNTVEAAVRQPQAAARNMVVALDDAKAGPLRIAGNPIKTSAYPDPPMRGPVPELDEDRARILRELDGA